MQVGSLSLSSTSDGIRSAYGLGGSGGDLTSDRIQTPILPNRSRFMLCTRRGGS